jgi:FKBP-type peptidyl-prolyl cis-trans isomerase SlyD
MENTPNKYIAVAYELYTVNDGKSELVEKASEEEPFQFLSGFGTTIEAFENNIVDLKEGEKFDFTLTKDEAYGDYYDERVLDLEKSIFTINGHFDSENICIGAIVPLQNADGNKFPGKVLDITEDHVKMDLNAPLAGKDLNFKGSVVVSREATNDEIQAMIDRMSGEGCECGCGGDCEGGCNDHHHDDGDCGCGCGHCH